MRIRTAYLGPMVPVGSGEDVKRFAATLLLRFRATFFVVFFAGFFAALLTVFFAFFTLFLAIRDPPFDVVRCLCRLPAHVKPVAVPVVIPNAPALKFAAPLRDVAVGQHRQRLAETWIAPQAAHDSSQSLWIGEVHEGQA